METTLLSMFHELNSFVTCAQHFDAAAKSGITVSNNKTFASLVREWSNGDYDECPELLVQGLTNLIH
jgi:hypothetical protein